MNNYALLLCTADKVGLGIYEGVLLPVSTRTLHDKEGQIVSEAVNMQRLLCKKCGRHSTG
jgi:hypothetical protein